MKSIFNLVFALLINSIISSLSFAQLTGFGTAFDKNGMAIFNYNVNQTKCSGSFDGFIQIIPIENEIIEFSVEWENGENTYTRENLPNGLYSASIKMGDKKIEYTFSISSPEPINATIFEVRKNNIRKLDLQIIGGTRPYSYEWNTGDTIEDLTDVIPGFYEVIIKDTNNCSQTATISVSIEEATSNMLKNFLHQTPLSYPNPSNGTFQLKGFDLNTEFQISDINNKIILTQSITNDLLISIPDLAVGEYYITGLENGEVTRLKIVIAK